MVISCALCQTSGVKLYAVIISLSEPFRTSQAKTRRERRSEEKEPFMDGN